jgi:hypothetical protein
MKLLLAIKSCTRDKDNGSHYAIRDTWGKYVAGADLRFFYGNGGGLLLDRRRCDETHLDVNDDYAHLQHKTREILRWSLAHDYGFTFLADNDTFLIPERLMKCGFEQYDYSGLFETGNVKLGTTFTLDWYGEEILGFYSWASGGYGYFVSRKAAEIVVATEPGRWTEDMFVGNSLGPAISRGEIKAGKLPEFQNQTSWHYHSLPGIHDAYTPTNGWMELMCLENA